jgi:hypothetical protein
VTDEIEGTAEVVGSEIVSAAPATLFRTDDPVRVLLEAKKVAEALKPVLIEQGMIQVIHGKGGPSEHVKVEGWQTLGAMLGVVPVITWTRKIDRGWEARCEARTLDERVIGAGEAECLKDEENWKDSEDYAVRSMAQTRATSKALSGPLRFVVTLAGYSATPAEEMPTGGFKGSSASVKQLQYVGSLLKGKKAGEIVLYLGRIGVHDVKPEDVEREISSLTRDQASQLIELLKSGWRPSVEHPSDVPSDTDGFEHEPPVEDDQLPFKP